MSETYLPYLDQDYQAIKEECLASGQLFEDSKFPAVDKSLFKFNKIHTGKITWKRASEITKDAKFILDGLEANDLDQGSLGDCWLISSLAAVAAIPKYIEKVVPNDQSFESGSYAGVFHFRIWRFGYWIDVVVDDFLPVNESGDLIFCRNKTNGNEMWGPLLEKAFAKVNACYEFIGNGGHSVDALVDLTGKFVLIKIHEIMIPSDLFNLNRNVLVILRSLIYYYSKIHFIGRIMD